jgi:hypothetical protein
VTRVANAASRQEAAEQESTIGLAPVVLSSFSAPGIEPGF